MPFPKKAAALAAGFVAALAAVCLAPLNAQNVKSGPETLVIEESTIDWIEKSNVAALREGVVHKMELGIGMPVAKGGVIGTLHSEMAELTVKKAEVAAKSTGPKLKAAAEKDLALAIVAINDRLNKKMKGAVSGEEQQKAWAQLKVAQATVVEAEERILLDQAELNLARRALEEHIIRAPFDGVIMQVIKDPGERVGANEAVVKLGNLSKLRAWAFVPLEYSVRVKEGQVVEIQPKLAGERHTPLPIEQKRFRGKITFVDPQVQPIGESSVRIYADFDNKDFDLRPGYKATMTIYLNSEGAAPAIGARTTPAGVGR